MTFEQIHLSLEGPIAVLTLAHPATLNAVSARMLDEMLRALDIIEDPARGVRCVVLTGEGRGFCSGANLAAKADITKPESEPGVLLEAYVNPLLRRFRMLRCPIVTAVNGVAAGVGMSFALIGDLIFAAESAYFLQAFRRVGLVPDGGATWLLPRMIGLARAKELSFLAEKLPAAKALEWGLINRVYPDAELMAKTRALAAELADGPTTALGLIHTLYWDSPENGLEDQINQERQFQRIAARTDDFREGVAAFLAKRPAKFKGR